MVSVIVPCHNGGRFIDALLQNLSAQTFRDFEVVIVDDGSTDEATLRKLDSLPGDIRLVRQEKRYLPGARNRGFHEARAEFVLPLDCDDALDPSFLAETVALLRKAPADVAFVFTHMRLTHALDGVLPRHFNRFDQLFLNQLPYCMLLRRSAWQAIGGYDESMRDGSEDWEFSIRLARAGFRGVELPKPLFLYRVSPDGMLMTHSVRMQGSIWRFIRRKHADLYRLSALAALRRATRSAPGRMSALTAAGLLGAALLLPEAWFNKLYYRVFTRNRSRRIGRGELRAQRAPGKA